ncbi:MAG: hypothetical protein H6512_12330 [Acidimicrobiia bacterium]|nr:hypothetical protein [Acidimicrobiia bacterium]
MESFRVRGATVALLTVVAVMLAAVSPVLQAGALAPLPASTAPTSNYGYTGGGQTYTVPSDVCYLDIVAIGGGGGSEEDGQGSGGSGARVTVNQVKVLPGTNISVQVGSGGARLNDSSGGGGYTGGFGRTGGNGAGAGIHDDSGAGGAATGVFGAACTTSSQVVVAALAVATTAVQPTTTAALRRASTAETAETATRPPESEAPEAHQFSYPHWGRRQRTGSEP